MTEPLQHGHGGARPGAGRPRLTLRQLVKARRFDSRNPRHRRALLEDELPADLAPELEQIARAYRGPGSPASLAWLAKNFEIVVADPDADARRERHLAALREQAQRARELQDRQRGEKSGDCEESSVARSKKRGGGS